MAESSAEGRLRTAFFLALLVVILIIASVALEAGAPAAPACNTVACAAGNLVGLGYLAVLGFLVVLLGLWTFRRPDTPSEASFAARPHPLPAPTASSPRVRYPAPVSPDSAAAPSARSFCPSCGSAIPPGNGYCSNCGRQVA